jgi:hypothetical protein
MLELYALPQFSPQTTPNKMGRRHLSATILCAYVKNIVYQIKISDLQYLNVRIRDAVVTVIPNTLQATWNEVEYSLDICRATKGAHTEI